ncbi:MAG: hypothetical protein ACFFAV_02540, partial [Candidatus Hermodarchaeota archaeon]
MENNNNHPTEVENEEDTKKGKKKLVAKDLVTLKHVETHKQVISPDTQDLAQVLKESYLEHNQFERLSNDE